MPTLEQLYARSLHSGLPASASARMLQARPEEPEAGQPSSPEIPDVNPGLVSRVGSVAGGGLSAFANILDLPGSSVRDLLAWENPFDQWWTPTRPDNRTTGRDLARSYGLAGDQDTWGNFGGGLATEILTDPLTWTGVGAFTKAGTALSKAGLAKSAKAVANQTAENLARSAGKTMGTKQLGNMGARMRMTPRQVIEGSDDVLDARSRWLQARGQLTLKEADDVAKIDLKWDAIKDTDDLLDKPIQSMLSFRIPGLMKEPLELTRDPQSAKSSIQKFVDRNAEPAPPGFQLPPGAGPTPPPSAGPTPPPGAGGPPSGGGLGYPPAPPGGSPPIPPVTPGSATSATGAAQRAVDAIPVPLAGAAAAKIPKVVVSDSPDMINVGHYDTIDDTIVLNKSKVTDRATRADTVRHEMAHAVDVVDGRTVDTGVSEIYNKVSTSYWDIAESNPTHPIVQYANITDSIESGASSDIVEELIASLYADGYQHGKFVVQLESGPVIVADIPSAMMEAMDKIENRLGIWGKKRARGSAGEIKTTGNKYSSDGSLEVFSRGDDWVVEYADAGIIQSFPDKKSAIKYVDDEWGVDLYDEVGEVAKPVARAGTLPTVPKGALRSATERVVDAAVPPPLPGAAAAAAAEDAVNSAGAAASAMSKKLEIFTSKNTDDMGNWTSKAAEKQARSMQKELDKLDEVFNNKLKTEEASRIASGLFDLKGKLQSQYNSLSKGLATPGVDSTDIQKRLEVISGKMSEVDRQLDQLRGSAFMPAGKGSPSVAASIANVVDVVSQYGEVWKSDNFRKISAQHERFDGKISGLVAEGAIKDTDADILRLAFSGASEDGMRLMNTPYIKAVDTLSAGEAGKAAGRWSWEVGKDSGLLEFKIEIAKDRPASQSGLSVLLHELGHMAQWEYRNIPGNSWGDELSKLIGKVQDSGRLKEELSALHGEKLGEYLANTFDEQFPQLFADSIIRRKVPQGALGKIITDVRDWVVQFLEKLKVIKSIPKPTQKKIDSIIDELMGFDKASAAKESGSTGVATGSQGKSLFERLQYAKDAVPGSGGSADMPLGATATATGKKFFDAVQVGKQKAAEQLKKVMDEDLAVAAADGLDTAARGLYKLPGAATLVALFNAPVRGGLNERGRDIGEMMYEALKESEASAVEAITPVVRAFEESGLFDVNKIVASGVSYEDAVKTLNNRDSALRAFLEYSPTKSTGAMPALPAELVALTPQLRNIRDMLDGVLEMEQAAGLNAKALQDKYLDYLMRYRRSAGKSGRHNPNQGSLMEISHSAFNAREFRDIPGGVVTLQAMSLDPVISGIVKLDPVVTGKIAEADWPRLRDHVANTYGDQLEEGFDITKFDPTKETKFDSYIRSMANLDPYHVQEQVPVFGRSILDDLHRRMKDGVRVSNNANTAQLLLGKTATAADATRNKVDDLVVGGATEADALRDAPQGYTVSKVLKDLKFERGRAWENTVTHMRPEAIAKRDAMLDVRRAEVDALLDGESTIIKTIDEGPVKLTRDANGDLIREVMPLDKSGKPMKGKATQEIVDDDTLNGFIRQEVNNDFLDGYSVEKDVHTQVTKWIKPFSNPDEVDQITKGVGRLVNVTKALWTAPWPAFHMRNRVSGMVHNWMLGATDPTASNPLMKFAKPEIQALALRNGETIEGISKEIKLFSDMTDKEATRKLSDLAAKYGVVGSEMGQVTEHIGESHQALRSLFPGLNSEVQPIQGMMDFVMGRFGEAKKKFSPAPAGTDTWDAFNPLAVRDGVGLGREGVINYTDDAFLGARIGRDVSSYVEDLNRLSPFIAYLKQGYSPAEAAKLSLRNQVDYTKLSAFERKYARLGIPFYTFSRGTLPVVLEELIHNPGGPMSQTTRVLNRSRTDDGMTPDYISNSASIPMGTKPDGTRSFLTGLGLAFEDPLNLMEGIVRGQPELTAKNILARSNPLIKATVEGVTGRSLYFDGPGGGRELVELDPPMGRTISNIRDLMTGERTEEAEPFISNRFEFLMGNSPAARAISTARTLTDPRKVIDRPIDTAINLTTGFRLRDLSPAAQDYAYKEKIAEALKDSGAREFRRAYLPDSRAERLGEDERELVDRMLQELKILDKRQKGRREAAEQAEQAPPNQKIQAALFK